MSVTTYQPSLNWGTVTDTKNMTVSVHELPTKPEIKVIVTPMPYDERLRKFLERPSPTSKTTSTISLPVPRPEEKDQRLALPVEMEAAVPQPGEIESERFPKIQLSRRERLSKWWKQERAEQKAFANAMAPYIAF